MKGKQQQGYAMKASGESALLNFSCALGSVGCIGSYFSSFRNSVATQPPSGLSCSSAAIFAHLPSSALFEHGHFLAIGPRPITAALAGLFAHARNR